MFCHKCGAQNEVDSRYCQLCGENISAEDALLLDRFVPPVQARQTSIARTENTAVLTHSAKPFPSAVAAPESTPPMKFMTRVAYNILQSDRKVVATVMICLLILVSGYIAVSSCVGLVSAFTNVSDAGKALASGIENELVSAGIDRAWRGVWMNLAAIPLSLLMFFLSTRLIVRVSRVRRTLRQVRREFRS